MATPISPLDLTAVQCEAIEVEVGAPIDQWRSVPKGTLLPLIIATVRGEDVATYRAMTLRQLADIVSLDAPDEDAGPNS